MQISITFCSPTAVPADAVGLGESDALVAVKMTVPEETGAGVTTNRCTSTHAVMRHSADNTYSRLSYTHMASLQIKLSQLATP